MLDVVCLVVYYPRYACGEALQVYKKIDFFAHYREPYVVLSTVGEAKSYLLATVLQFYSNGFVARLQRNPSTSQEFCCSVSGCSFTES